MRIKNVCREIVVGEDRIETLGEFRARFGEPSYMHKDRLYADEHCLCPVDIEATAKRLGYTVVVEAIDYVLTPINRGSDE